VKKMLRGLKALASLVNPKTWGPFLHAWEKTRFDHDFTVSFSQFGEDLALLNLIGHKTGRYLDIGAHHPSRYSNTRLLYDRGWSGINVDANPELIDAFKRLRPRDVNLWACVGSRPSYTFTIFKEPAVSTFNQEWKKKFLASGWSVHKEIKVQGTTLRTLLDTYSPEGALDLLLIDAEGADHEILESADFSTLPIERHPHVILVEAPQPVAVAIQEKTITLLKKFGYEPAVVLISSTILTKWAS
jgi:FkbM family methyltransferase